jgi:hypothetical protein
MNIKKETINSFPPEMEVKLFEPRLAKLIESLTFNSPARREEEIKMAIRIWTISNVEKARNRLFNFSEQPVWIVLARNPAPIVEKLIAQGQIAFVPATPEDFLMLVEEYNAREILETINKVGAFDKKSHEGIAFQIDVEYAVGVMHQVDILNRTLKEEL